MFVKLSKPFQRNRIRQEYLHTRPGEGTCEDNKGPITVALTHQEEVTAKLFHLKSSCSQEQATIILICSIALMVEVVTDRYQIIMLLTRFTCFNIKKDITFEYG